MASFQTVFGQGMSAIGSLATAAATITDKGASTAVRVFSIADKGGTWVERELDVKLKLQAVEHAEILKNAAVFAARKGAMAEITHLKEIAAMNLTPELAKVYVMAYDERLLSAQQTLANVE